jgi:hypothetical protein
MSGFGKNIFQASLFNDFRSIHHHHSITHLPDDPHVMGNQQNGGLLLPHFFDQFKNL